MSVKLRAAAIWGFLSVLFYVSGLLTLLTPLPLFYVALTKGKGAATSVLLSALLSLFSLTNFVFPLLSHHDTPLSSLFFSLPPYIFFATIGIVLAFGVEQKYSLSRWIGTACFSSMIVAIVFAALMHFSGMVSLVDELRSVLFQVLDQLIAAGKVSGNNEIQLRYLEERREEIAQFVFYMAPALLFVISMLTTVMNALLGRSFMTSRHQQIVILRGFSRYRLPDIAIWGIIAGGVAFFLDTYIVHATWLQVIALNVLLCLCLLFFLQGFSVAVFFVQGFRLPFLRTIFYVVFILFLHTLGLLLLGLGIADVWGHFREKRLTRPS